MANFNTYNVKISSFISNIKSGKYRLPCFQREFRWNPAKIKSLINSIQHEYPAGSLLFLKVDRDDPLIPFQEFKYAVKENFTDKPEDLVLDGQQRMTSCFSVFTNQGYYSYFIDYKQLMKQFKDGVTDYDFETLVVNKRHVANLVGELSNGLFPLSYLIDRKTMNQQIQAFLQDNEDKEVDEFLNGEFRNIVDSIMDYEFPVVELPDDSSMEAVCKVFQTINTTGLKLSVFDICVAVFMPQNINLKEKVKVSSSNYKYVKLALEKDATMALQIVALLAGKAPNTNTLARVLQPEDINDYWDDAIKGIEATLELFDSFGAGTTKNLSLLPYTPMIPIVAAVLAKTKYADMSVPAKSSAQNKLKRFFYTVSMATRYTEGTNAKINDDFKALNKWISNDQIPDLVSKGVDWNTEKIVTNNKNGAFGKAVLCLINSQNPKDFYSQSEAVGLGKDINSCELHHIFPKAEYEDKYNELINSVFNYTWLLKETNNYIKDAKTCSYLDGIISETNISEDQLKSVLSDHLITGEVYDKLKAEDYNSFISGRAEGIKNMFDNIGVIFRSVNQDELEVEEDDSEEDEDE